MDHQRDSALSRRSAFKGLERAGTVLQWIHEDTELGDTRVQRAVNDEVVHQPQQVVRVVVNETVTEEDWHAFGAIWNPRAW